MNKSLSVVVAAVAFSVVSSRASFADTATLDAAGQRMVVIVEKVGSIAVEQKANCDEMGTQLGSYADSTASERAQLNATLQSAGPMPA